jgi:TonB family protein
MSHSAIHPRQPRSRHAFASVVRAIPFLALLALAIAPARAQERAAVRKVAPSYPALAKQMGVTGTVVVTATVDPSGKVIKAESTSGNKLLVSAALDAVKQWKFAPGDTTESFPITINFERN